MQVKQLRQFGTTRPLRAKPETPKAPLLERLDRNLSDSFQMMAQVKGAVTGFAAGASAFSMLTAATGTAVALGTAGSLLGVAAAGLGLAYLGARLGGALAGRYLAGVDRVAQRVEKFTGSNTLGRVTSAAAKIIPVAMMGDFVAVSFTNGAKFAVGPLAVFGASTALGMMELESSSSR